MITARTTRISRILRVQPVPADLCLFSDGDRIDVPVFDECLHRVQDPALLRVPGSAEEAVQDQPAGAGFAAVC
jgi:hypothetical protein